MRVLSPQGRIFVKVHSDVIADVARAINAPAHSFHVTFSGKTTQEGTTAMNVQQRLQNAREALVPGSSAVAAGGVERCPPGCVLRGFPDNGPGVPGTPDTHSRLGGPNHWHCQGELCTRAWIRTDEDGTDHFLPTGQLDFGPGCMGRQFPMPSLGVLLADNPFAQDGVPAASLSASVKRSAGY